jgi:hypothetical protein
MSKTTQKMDSAKAERIGASIPAVPKTQSAAQTVSDAVKAQSAPAVTATQAVATATALPAPKAKRISHLALGLSLAERNAPQSEIDAAFLASFTQRGVTDTAWIAKRRDIYMRIGFKKIAQRMPKAQSATK